MIRVRKVYTDDRGRRAASGYVVASTDHPAAGANTPVLRQRFELDGGGAATLQLPPGVYLLAAQLVGQDGRGWTHMEYLTVEER